MGEDEPLHGVFEPAARTLRLDLGAGVFHHMTVADPRWTRRFAAAASQAEVDVLNVRRRDRGAVRHLHHLVDAAARRVHLDAELAIGGAGVQTKTAMHATVEVELPRSQSGFFRYDGTIGHGSTGSTDRRAS